MHETQHEAERCIEQARTDIEMLEEKLFELGWTPDMLNEKERTRNERRKRSCRSSNEDMPEEEVEPEEKVEITTKQVRNFKTLFNLYECSGREGIKDMRSHSHNRENIR